MSVEAFNSLLTQFADELELVFGQDEPMLSMFNVGLKTKIAQDPSEPLRAFNQHVGPHTQRILQNDPTLLQEIPQVLGGVDIHRLYNSASEQTQQTIFSYLSSLAMLSTAISNLPPELMSSIEKTVQQLASNDAAANQMQQLVSGLASGSSAGAGGGLAGMMNMLGGMGGLGGLASLFGSLAGGSAGGFAEGNPR